MVSLPAGMIDSGQHARCRAGSYYSLTDDPVREFNALPCRDCIIGKTHLHDNDRPTAATSIQLPLMAGIDDTPLT